MVGLIGDEVTEFINDIENEGWAQEDEEAPRRREQNAEAMAWVKAKMESATC